MNAVPPDFTEIPSFILLEKKITDADLSKDFSFTFITRPIYYFFMNILWLWNFVFRMFITII